MRIGILTFHRAHNYGAVLQCYALQEVLKRMGHDVQVIDYRQPWIDDFYRPFAWNMIRRNLYSVPSLFRYLKRSLFKWFSAPFKASYFKGFRNRFLNLSAPSYDKLPRDYDCYVVGSDQLWSLHCLGGVADMMYLGDFERPAGSRLVAYAVSADMKSVVGLKDILAESLSGFDAVSMREKTIAEAVMEATGYRCEACLDPTLLTDAALWDPLVHDVCHSEYVLVYEVKWNPQTKGRLRKKAEELAASVGPDCKVIDLSRVNRPVEEFVSLFRNASYVVTTSFHGIAFSIIFGVPFFALPLWDGSDLRYMELLRSVGAADRIVGFDSELIPSGMDFTTIRENLAELRKSSFEFIERNINGNRN